jgi:hypothetical protein
MIDSDILVRYTDALYKTPPEQAPRYDEFRDMFSSGQIYSKKWLVDELDRLETTLGPAVTICGSWFGLLAFFLNKKFPIFEITCVDIDPRCEIFFKNLVQPGQEHFLKALTTDMYDYAYQQGLVINTSCEHIPDLNFWLQRILPNSVVALQSSNFRLSTQHVACVDSVEELTAKCGSHFDRILFSGELKFPMYSRYMLIGIKN